MSVLSNIGHKIKNFAHNTLKIAEHLLRIGLLVAGIGLYAFYGVPLTFVLFYGLVTAVMGNLLFKAAHAVVNYLSNLFNDPKGTAKESTPAAAPAVEKRHQHTQSSAVKIHSELKNNPVAANDAKPEVKDTATQTSVKNAKRQNKVTKEHDEQASQAYSQVMR